METNLKKSAESEIASLKRLAVIFITLYTFLFVVSAIGFMYFLRSDIYRDFLENEKGKEPAANIYSERSGQ